VARRVLRVLTSAALAGLLWAGQLSVTETEPTQLTLTSVASVSFAAQRTQTIHTVMAVEPRSGIDAGSYPPVAPAEIAPMREDRHGEPGQDRAPPKR
jgi:hypothetical protein